MEATLAVSRNGLPHHRPRGLADHMAWGLVVFLRIFVDLFFKGRYGHHAVVLETVAAVPGIVGGALVHLRCLRRLESDSGWVQTLLDEASNERMHLMIFLNIARPTWLERGLIVLAQGVFFNAFFLLYLFWPRAAHRFVGYLEEEAYFSYTEYLSEIDAGKVENIEAPRLAIEYYDLADSAGLREVVVAVREDEARHRDVNHGLADVLTGHLDASASGPIVHR